MNGDAEEKDYSLLDGWDELPENYQEKIRKAMAQGHVDDEDWNGVSPFIAKCPPCLVVETDSVVTDDIRIPR